MMESGQAEVNHWVAGSKQQALRVLHISTYDNQGGAARSALRIHQCLGRLGLESSMLVWRKGSADDRVVQFNASRSLLTRARGRLRREWRLRQYARHAVGRRDPFQPFSDDRSDCLVDIRRCRPRPDVVNLYWIAGFIDYGYFFGHLPADVPIVWRLSDMNPFTGGCHFSYDCQRWTDRCGTCPELASNRANDLSHQIWKRKRNAYTGHAIHVVAPSKWIAKEAERSSLLRDQPVTVIPNGLDTTVFRTMDRAQARGNLGLPQDCAILLSVADYLHDARKGMALLLEALDRISDMNNVMLLTVGESRDGGYSMPHLAYRSLGRIDDNALLAAVYAAVDVFVAPSVQDNLPNTVLEAMACGTPTVAFDVGGFSDVVLPGVTGLLARSSDAVDLARQIRWVLDNPGHRQAMGVAARHLIEREHAQEIEARRFTDLYFRIANRL